MDSVLACGAGEPGSIPVLSKWFFSRVLGGRIKMDPDTTNYMLLCIQVDKNDNCHQAAN